MEKPTDFENVEELAIALTRTASVTDSPGEKAFPGFLQALLGQLPYFRNNPADLGLSPIPDDPRERSNLYALVRGKGKRCIVLTGHYDVVHTSMYGALEPWAFDPQALSARLLESLVEPPAKDSPRARIRDDLASGNFLPGRGLLDMKSGLAAGISVLASFSASQERKGSILFLTVADEEGSSHGMRAAAPMLKGFLAARGLEPVAVFNLDAAVDQESGDTGRAVFTGSVGKTLPFVHFIGKCSHAGAPFDGINPVMLASEFAREVESNPDTLNERQVALGEEPPPPTILYFRESRKVYDVTTPQTVFCALNVLSHTREPQDTLEAIGKICLVAMNKAISTLRERASTLSRRVSGHFSIPARQPEIIDFDQFAAMAERLSPGLLARARASAATRVPGDRVQQTHLILEELLPFSGVEGPAAVIGFAPPYYARAELDTERDRAFLAMLKAEISEYSMETGTSVRVRPYFPGISDMSFLAPADSAAQRAFARAQMPVTDPGTEEASRMPIGCPVVNIGPWGRDYHQIGERVHRQYAFVELPALLARLVKSSLELEA